MSTEWNIPDPSTPVRQGDLMICRDPKTGKIREISLVITADCDIDKVKFGRHLACLRVIPFVEYIRTVWAARKLQRLMANDTKTVWSQMTKWHSKCIGSESSLSTEAATEWVMRVGPDFICRDLQVPDTDLKKVTASLAAFRSALFALANAQEEDQFSQFVAFRSAIKGRDCHQEIVKQAQDESKSGLPEDVFLLPTLPQLDIGPSVVLLREVVAVPYETVCYRTCDATSSDMYLRIGRLQPTYKYALSQSFGVLYSKIGLPKEYEQRCDEVLNQITTFVLEKPCTV